MTAQEMFFVCDARAHEAATIEALYDRDRVRRGDGALWCDGAPVKLSGHELRALWNTDTTIRVIAQEVRKTKSVIIGHASLHYRVLPRMGGIATVEDVVTDPDFEGRGVARGVMSSALRFAFDAWFCRCVELVCVPERERARRLYLSLGFVQHTNTDRFTLTALDRTRLLADIGGWATNTGGRLFIDTYTFTPFR